MILIDVARQNILKGTDCSSHAIVHAFQKILFAYVYENDSDMPCPGGTAILWVLALALILYIPVDCLSP